MPLVTVSALVAAEMPVERVLVGIAARLAESLNRPIADVWVRLVPLAAGTSGSRSETVADQHPTFEIVTGPLGAGREKAALEAVAGAVAEGLGVPLDAVWGRFVPLDEGHLISGGRTS